MFYELNTLDPLGKHPGNEVVVAKLTVHWLTLDISAQITLLLNKDVQ